MPMRVYGAAGAAESPVAKVPAAHDEHGFKVGTV